MPSKEIPLTKAGLHSLKDELAELEEEKLQQVQERVKRARSFCDFHEDSEYNAALTEQEIIQQKIADLKHTVKQATILKPTDLPVVELGKTVVIKEFPEGAEETYTIVHQAEADPFQARISDRSPMAKSLLKAQENDKVTVTTPMGERNVKIIKVY